MPRPAGAGAREGGMTAAGAEVKAVGAEHAQVLAALQQGCFTEAWDAAAMADLVTAPGGFAFVATSARQPLGFILCRCLGGEGEVIAFGVSALHRGRGVGALLLQAALTRAAEAGAARMVLEVAVDNAPARGLYAAWGFAQVGQRRSYYARSAAVHVDALILACDLTPRSVDRAKER